MPLAQPINRNIIFLSEYLAVSMSLCFAFIAGIGIPAVIFGAGREIGTLLFVGTLLTLVFTSFAFLSAVLTRDKAKAIGVALLFWFYFSLIYDGIVLWVIYAFNDYPLEKATLALTALNPVDLARIILLLQLDISALMGYTGAFYREFFGTNTGFMFSSVILMLWVILPIVIASFVFSKKDI
jgi:Cu-processing system permease protein